MQLYTPDQMPGVIQGRICRQSRLVSVVGAVVMSLMLFGFPLFILAKLEPAAWVWIPIVGIVLLIVWCLMRMAAKALRADNWLMRIAPDGLWVNLRSYLNREFALAKTVVFLPYAAIEGVRQHTVRRADRHGSRTTTWTDQYLEIQLREPVPNDVAAEIAEERRRLVENSHLGGFVTSRGRHNHVPVTVSGEDSVRIQWRGRQDFVVPGLKRVLRELAAECTVCEPTHENLQNMEAMSSDELDRLILGRVEAGDTLGATKLLRDKRGYSLKDARDFVEALTARL